MGIKRMQEDDLIDIALDEDDGADAGVFIPAGQPDPGDGTHAQGMPVLGIMNEAAQTMTLTDGDAIETRRATWVGSRAQLRAIIARMLGDPRDPARQDEIAFAVGSEFEGIWVVERVTVDASGGASLEIRWDRIYAIRGQGVTPA